MNSGEDEYTFEYEDDEGDYELEFASDTGNGDSDTVPDLSITKDDSEFEVSSGTESDYDKDMNLLIPENGTGAATFTDYNVTNADAYEQNGLPKIHYNCLTTEQIFGLMLHRVEHLQPVLNIPVKDIIILLQNYGWSEERLLEKYTEDMDGVLVSAGLKSKSLTGSKQNRGIQHHKNFMCYICCESDKEETFTLECGHEYCLECYKHYIQDKLADGKIITCMSCDLSLKNEDIDTIMGDNSSAKLMNSSIKSFIHKHNKHYKWCPFADCNCVIQVENTSSLSEFPRLRISPFVTCDNQHRFCFTCAREVHAPADCKVSEAWVKKAQAESENLNWVLAHTKECPKCGVNIEKNGGCNHMTCKSCAYEFCWVCEGDWKNHGGSFYECVRFKKEDKKDSVENKRSLQKYTHYYRLFNEHENSAKLDMKLGQTVEQKVRVLQDSLGISWIEGQFLPESIRTLIEGRTALKWSFPLAYYSDQSHNMTKIFIENQMLLVNAVENLSQLLQIKNPQQMMDKKLDFYNKARFVKSRELALVECGRELLMKGICCAPG